MDFLLTEHKFVLEVKRIRDRAHATKVGDELIIDIAHYSAHQKCERLWCVIYDPNHFITNRQGLISELEGENKNSNGAVNVRLFVIPK
jgi:hypothetical protein